MPQTFEASGAGIVSQPHSFTGAPLLTGFKVDFHKKDRQILALGLSALYDTVNSFSGTDLRSTVTAQYFDNFISDEFTFVVRYHDEIRPGVIIKHVEGRSSGGEFTFPLNFPAEGHTFALIGFDFRFDQPQCSRLFFFRPPYKDHHIGTVSIRVDASQENLSVQFADKNNDDTYVWQVWYAWLPNEIVEQTNTISGSGAKGNDSGELEPGGIAVLRGFTLTYASLEDRSGKDHHSDEIGVMIDEPAVAGGASPLQVFLNDKNDDDKFAWAVDYLTLRSQPVIL